MDSPGSKLLTPGNAMNPPISKGVVTKFSRLGCRSMLPRVHVVFESRSLKQFCFRSLKTVMKFIVVIAKLVNFALVELYQRQRFSWAKQPYIGPKNFSKFPYIYPYIFTRSHLKPCISFLGKMHQIKSCGLVNPSNHNSPQP